jgi:hypothetical protein
MHLERRLLYNSLRMNWLMNPSLPVHPWQVEDYRLLTLEQLFQGMKVLDFALDRVSFVALAENAESPEELTDDLLADSDLSAEEQDKIYLLIFELWRRLVPEKPSLSIFCDELDYEIYRYDTGEAKSPEAMQDILANLAVVLDENVDAGADPHEAFQTIAKGCANDIGTFIYDFIADQIDQGNEPYAIELLEDFSEYVSETKWFDFLHARVLSKKDPEGTNEVLNKLTKEALKRPDLEFNLELLSFMVLVGEKELFVKLVKQSMPMLKYEEEFQDLLSICADYCNCLDLDKEEQLVLAILEKRSQIPFEAAIQENEPQLAELLKILKR